MNETVHTFFQTDKGTEIGEGPHLALDNASHGIFLSNYIPGVGLSLFYTQGYSPVVLVNIENLGFYGLTHRYQFAGIS